MANVLYLDDNAAAGSAMKGILARAHHRCVVAATTTEAWQRLLELVQIDLVILELRLKGENGMALIKQLRTHCNLKDIPVAVYSQVSDWSTIQAALALGIQGYFIKPFDEAVVQRAVKKAVAFSWRSPLFAEEQAFCTQFKIGGADLRKVQEDLLAAMDRAIPALMDLPKRRDLREAVGLIEPLAERAEAAGVWAISHLLGDLRADAETGNWAAFEQAGPEAEFARRLSFCHLNPGYLSAGFLSLEEVKEKEEAAERARWLEADAKGSLPFAAAAEVKARLDRLSACPAVESAVAFFAIQADGKASSLSPLMDLVSRDPGLAMLVLIAANQLPREEKLVIDDPRAAVSLLGEIRLCALARTIPAIPERHLNFPPFGWPEFWMFQVGTAHLAKFVCDYLELDSLAPMAATLGLTHDVGKLLLASLYPFSVEAVAQCAKERAISFDAATRRFFGASTGDFGSHFAQKNGLPGGFAEVMAGVDAPAREGDNALLIAIVALARYFCLQHRVGHNGEPQGAARTPIEQTAAWGVLRARAFPGFDLRKFEAAAKALCLNLKPDLLGRDHAFRTSKEN